MITNDRFAEINSYNGGSLCRLASGSMTAAMKSQRLLAKNAIRVNVVKIATNQNDKGCVYGIEFPCVLSGNIRSMLEQGGISTRQ